MSTLVTEKKKPSKDWTSVNGLYADLSGWPNEVKYYVECPKCHTVHGGYKTMKEAHSQRLCDLCNLKTLGKIKDQIRQVIAEPEKKVRTLASIVRESEFDKLPPAEPTPEPPGDADDAFLGRDPMAEIDRYLFSDWTKVAVRDLVAHLDLSIDDAEINTNKYAPGDYDADNSNESTHFEVEISGQTWSIFKDDDTAVAYAEELVRNDVENEPGMFSEELLSRFIDADELKAAIGDPYDDWGDEERGLDYDDLLDKMVEEDQVESDDPVFFKVNGDHRVATKARQKQLEAILDTWIEETKPDFEPWEWLHDVFGKEKAAEEAIKLASPDANELAEYVVSSDGWQNTVARYDGNSIELENGAVAARTN